MDDIKHAIGAFLSEALHYDLDEHEDLFALDFVKSISIFELVLFIEREFDIRVERLHREIESFRTVTTIAQLVERKIATCPQGQLDSSRSSARVVQPWVGPGRRRGRGASTLYNATRWSLGDPVRLAARKAGS
jgi:acyl carrier protein